MKKITILVFLLVANLIFAQENLKNAPIVQTNNYQTRSADATTVFTENFNTWPNGWSISSEAGSTASGLGLWHHNTASNYADINYVNGTMVHNEWLVSPTITVPSGVIKLQFDWQTSYYWLVDEFNNGDLNVYISTDNGATWSSSLFTEDNEGVFENYTWATKVVDISAYAGQDIKIGFNYTAVDAAQAGFDNISVFTVDQIDATMQNINMTSYTVPGTTLNVAGELYNNGYDAITSYDVSYNINGGTESATYSVNSNIAFSNTGVFTHNVPYTFANSGDYNVNVTISNVNGGGEVELGNNVNTKFVSVATQTVSNTALFESFTSSTCGPCAGFNGNTFNPFMTSHNDIAVIKYQMNWPAPGDDAYYTLEGGSRRGYYNVSSIPDLFVGGTNNVSTQGGSAPVDAAYASENAKQTYFTLDADFTLNGNIITIDTNIDPYITGNFTLHTVVVEKLTTGNASTNGETSFENVMMKMLPNASGELVNFTLGTAYTNSQTFDMSTTFIEEISDLALIVFIQDDNNKTVLQSVYKSEETVAGVNDLIFDTVSLYPNPTNGLLNIKTDRELQLNISDVLGRTVLANIKVNNNDSVDLSILNNGVYFVQINDGNIKGTKKIILNK